MSFPRITIVTPSYNQAPFLEQTIQSVLGQNYPDLQYGVVDGGSTDGSVDIIQRFRDRLHFAIVEPDHGQSEAINKGFVRADGQILGWLNSDDTLCPGALEVVGRHFQEHPDDDWIVGCAWNVDADGQPLGDPPLQTHGGEFSLAGALIREGGFNIPQPATFFRARLLEGHGLLDETLHHCMDFELWCRFLAAGHRPALLDQVLATYRFHASSKSSSEAHAFVRTLITIERRYAPCLPWRQRHRLRWRIGYQDRAWTIQTDPRGLWKRVLARPWWIGSQQVRQALRSGHHRKAA